MLVTSCAVMVWCAVQPEILFDAKTVAPFVCVHEGGSYAARHAGVTGRTCCEMLVLVSKAKCCEFMRHLLFLLVLCEVLIFAPKVYSPQPCLSCV